MKPRKVVFNTKKQAIIYPPARDRDDLNLKKGDRYITKVDKRKRRLIICFEQEEK